MSIKNNLQTITDQLPKQVQLVAVSKFHPVEAIMKAYNAGQRIFGESRAQEIDEKQKLLPQDICWHFIGHLQRNKVKQVAPYVSMIHSVESYRLLKEINKQAKQNNRIIDCLLQIKIAQEETKFGLQPQECFNLLTNENWRALENIRICGLMGMASNVENQEQIQKEFLELAHLFEKIKQKWFKDVSYFKELSIGMSHDYSLAIQAGSTLIRVGSKIFGSREY